MVLQFFGKDGEEPKCGPAPSGSSLPLVIPLVPMYVYVCTAKWPFAAEVHHLHSHAGRLPIAFLPMNTATAIQTENPNLSLAHNDLTFSGSAWKVQGPCSKLMQSQRISYSHVFWGPTPAWCWSKEGLTLLKSMSMKSMAKAVSVLVRHRILFSAPWIRSIRLKMKL